MKSLVLVMGMLVMGQSAFAAGQCEQTAKDAVAAIYGLNAASIQGSDPLVEVVGQELLSRRQALVKVAVSDSNDEQESWVIDYDVKMDMVTCYVSSVIETKVTSVGGDE